MINHFLSLINRFLEHPATRIIARMKDGAKINKFLNITAFTIIATNLYNIVSSLSVIGLPSK
jgi:hypothetical protein